MHVVGEQSHIPRPFSVAADEVDGAVRIDPSLLPAFAEADLLTPEFRAGILRVIQQPVAKPLDATFNLQFTGDDIRTVVPSTLAFKPGLAAFSLSA